jgi:Arc/MetJ-type ribon-helix-helix transcriptional regulator
MRATRLAITLDERLIRKVDRWVKEGRYPNRSQAIQAALREKEGRRKRTRLAEELKKLDPREERALADEKLAGESRFAS